ncbi:MAG: hypothetical protein RR860_06845 [Janthinobacterium sp.]
MQPAQPQRQMEKLSRRKPTSTASPSSYDILFFNLGGNMGVKLANNAESKTIASITSTQSTLTLDAGGGSKFPLISQGGSDWFPITIFDAQGNLELAFAGRFPEPACAKQ